MHDVIVCGARVAGSPLAMLLARAGLKVLLVDRAEFPSDVVSTHFLHPRGTSYLNHWGLLAPLLERGTPSWTAANTRVEDIQIVGRTPLEALRARLRRAHGWPESDPLPWATDVYIAPRRTLLDALLLEAAAASGAEVRTSVSVQGLEVTDGRVQGLRLRTRDGKVVTERARCVVGADGRNSTVARLVQAETVKHVPRCGYAYYSYFSGLKTDGLIWPNWCGRGRLAAVAFDTNGGQVLIAVMGPQEWNHAFREDVEGNFHKNLEYAWPELAERVRSGAQREERFYGTVDQPAILRKAHGPGWALLGDALCQRDQCTAIGITHAFRDVELLSQALLRGLGGGGELTAALAGYEQQHRQDSMAYFDFVCQRAEFNVTPKEKLALLAAMRGNSAQMDAFEGVAGDANPVEAFFAPENVTRILEEADPSLPPPRMLQSYEAMLERYSVNPFLSVPTARSA